MATHLLALAARGRTVHVQVVFRNMVQRSSGLGLSLKGQWVAWEYRQDLRHLLREQARRGPHRLPADLLRMPDRSPRDAEIEMRRRTALVNESVGHHEPRVLPASNLFPRAGGLVCWAPSVSWPKWS